MYSNIFKKIFVPMGLKICAPEKDMDIPSTHTKTGNFIIEKIYVPDPVVLQPVKGGFIIVAAWGDEASDDLVINPINN